MLTPTPTGSPSPTRATFAASPLQDISRKLTPPKSPGGTIAVNEVIHFFFFLMVSPECRLNISFKLIAYLDFTGDVSLRRGRRKRNG